MESNVWMQWFAQGVTYLSNLFAYSNNQKSQNNGGVLPNVQENVVASTSTSMNVTNLVVKRERKTNDATFATIQGDDGKIICFGMENSAHLIVPGTYSARLDKSPHLGYVCPHLRVPERDALAGGDAGIRLHIANFPSQLEGCIGLGLEIGPDCLNHSQAAFDRLMAVLPQEFSVIVSETY